jgi:mannose-1-phosphate guanylyltransferase/mannose-6-phosphate isomerase
MLQNTVQRLGGLVDAINPVVICNDEYRFMVAEQLRLLGVTPGGIILEPVGRNTAPALAVAALWALDKGMDPVLLVLPADHHIQSGESFRQTLQKGYDYARSGHLITFGIIPEKPETGYGYIKMGRPLAAPNGGEDAAVAIDAFVEKPDRETARGYVDSKKYCWNSGMFMFLASKAIEELEKFAPDILSACRQAVEKGKTDLDFFRLDKGAFSASPSDSIDYAVMEKTAAGAMVPMAAGWNDLGSWEALWQVGEKDEHENVIHGDVLVHDVKNSFLHASTRLLTAVGLEDHIVVETSDAVLISPRSKVQDIKSLVNILKTDQREEALSHKKIYRPWGSSETIVISDRFQVKRVIIKPGAKLALQKHFNRAEHWIVLRGTALVRKEDEEFLLKEDNSTYIPLGIKHRLENPGKIPLELIEVRSGSYLGEDDIVRFDEQMEGACDAGSTGRP